MRKRKCPPQGASRAYLVSFGDTMTALLAFFIVLNSLADEQTGANLHAGTGSFVRALQSFGLPGVFSQGTSARSVQMQESGPLYLVPGDPDADPELNPKGPDEDDDGGRVIDREQEQFERFLREMKRFHDIEPQQPVTGEISFDFFMDLPKEGEPLSKPLLDASRKFLPLLNRDDFEVELTVWAAMPRPTSWRKAVETSTRLADQITETAGLSGEAGSRLKAVARPWISSTERRPTLTLTARKSGRLATEQRQDESL